MTDDEPGHANEAQYEAARRFFARHQRPTDRWARWHHADLEEQRQDRNWEARGGNL